MQCVLMLNALQKQGFWTTFFCGFGCRFGSNFLQIEMQNHSKWQKSERKARNVGRPFHHSAAFYIGFARQFLLEWFAKKLRFVKFIYHFNKPLTCQLQCPRPIMPPARQASLLLALACLSGVHFPFPFKACRPRP